MNKIFKLLLIILFAVCIQSCKKNTAETPSPDNDKIYLVSKITWHYNNGDDIEKLIYDEKDRVINVKFVGQFEHKYTYDSNDRVIEVKSYSDFAPNEFSITTYQYLSDNIHVKITDGRTGNQIAAYTYILKDGKAIKYGMDGGDYAFVYDYDNKGNLKKVQQLTVKGGELSDWGNYQHDDKKSPYSMIKGLNFHFMFALHTPTYSPVNNIINNYLVGGTFITYKYNDAGFPVIALLPRDNYPDLKVDYEYIIK
jgi:YD repeat-containing protein